MDTPSLVSEPNSEKLDVEDSKHEDEISLNDLPDTILIHILSFLPTKFSFRTCVLSKRWQYLRASVPSLEFENTRASISRDFVFEENPRHNSKTQNFLNKVRLESKIRRQISLFMYFLGRVLEFHNAPRIQKFSLSCDVDGNNHDHLIKKWISTVVNRKPQEFDIKLRFWLWLYTQVCPDCLWSCGTLEVLKIDAPMRVSLPSQVDLPCLKILTLKYLHLENYNATNSLFASPALEELVIDHCKFEKGPYEYIISAPKLRKLTIHDTSDGENSVTISAPTLEIFWYIGGFMKHYRSIHSSSLSIATLRAYGVKEIQGAHLDEVLRSLQSVKYLDLSAAFVEALSHETMPIFKNLFSLEISEKPVNLSCEELEKILSICPNLEILRFPEGISEACSVDSLLNSNFTTSSKLKKIMIGDQVVRWMMIGDQVVRWV